ncbi:MAG: MarR family transcriptional regulator [Thalassovita sp.]|nr:MarR family transcriptional regulator [Thalassovita sp.]
MVAAKKNQAQETAGGDRLDTALRGFLGYRMKRATNILQADAARVLDEFGLRVTTYSALAVICDHPDVTQSQIAAALNMERSNTVLIIDALEEAGLIGRHRVPTDRRSYALRATLEGMKVRDAATAALGEHEDSLLHDLSREERATLMALLGRIASQA